MEICVFSFSAIYNVINGSQYGRNVRTMWKRGLCAIKNQPIRILKIMIVITYSVCVCTFIIIMGCRKISIQFVIIFWNTIGNSTWGEWHMLNDIIQCKNDKNKCFIGKHCFPCFDVCGFFLGVLFSFQCLCTQKLNS